MLPDIIGFLVEYLRSAWEDIDAALQPYDMRLKSILPYYADISFEIMPCVLVDDVRTQMEWEAIGMIARWRHEVRVYGYLYHELPEVRRAALFQLGMATQITLNRLPTPQTIDTTEVWWRGVLCPVLEYGVGILSNSTVGAFSGTMEVEAYVQLGS